MTLSAILNENYVVANIGRTTLETTNKILINASLSDPDTILPKVWDISKDGPFTKFEQMVRDEDDKIRKKYDIETVHLLMDANSSWLYVRVFTTGKKKSAAWNPILKSWGSW